MVWATIEKPSTRRQVPQSQFDIYRERQDQFRHVVQFDCYHQKRLDIDRPEGTLCTAYMPQERVHWDGQTQPRLLLRVSDNFQQFWRPDVQILLTGEAKCGPQVQRQMP